MIKKILGLATICLLSITTASAYTIQGGIGRDFEIGEYGWYTNATAGVNNITEEFNGTILDNNFNFGNGFVREFYTGNAYLWRTDYGLHYQVAIYNSTNINGGVIDGFFSCSSNPLDTNVKNYLRLDSRCTYHSGFDSLSVYLENVNAWAYRVSTSSSTNNVEICSQLSNGNFICMDKSYPTSTTSEKLTSSTISSLAKKNPFSNNGGSIPQRNSNSICPTMGQILNNYPTAYNTGLCYNSTLRYNNGQIETVEQKTIQETFENYNELQERWNIYNNNCRVPYTQEQCQGAFSGQRNKYSIISNAFNGNTESKRLWNYCNIYLNYDLNMSSCVASGWQGEKFTEKEIENTLLGLDNIRVLTPATGNILNGLLGSGQTREDINIYDVLGNLDQIKEKITSIFKERNGVDGIIPDYILWLILTTLLLTVLLKK